MTKKRIAILIHKDDAAFVYFKYLIKLLMKEWKALGFAVEIIRGIERFVPADIVIPHLDLTIVPEDYREFLSQYPVVVNRRLVDISKSNISSNLIGKDDPYTGPVIVKTDFNSGGLPETRLSRLYLLRALTAKVTDQMSLGRRTKPSVDGWGQVKHLSTVDYRVFPSLQDVPEGVFTNKNLVVEKFLPEIHGDQYCVRYYVFLGDRELVEIYRSKDKIVKGSNRFELSLGPVPPELHELRQQLGMDYGKIDFVIRDGNPVVLDINRTPGVPEPENDDGESALRKARHLAEGIWSHLA